MKKLLLVSLLWVGLAGVAHATVVDCSVLMAANTSGSTGSTCTVAPDPGFFISTLTLTGTDDYTGYLSGNPVVSFGATLSQSSTLFSALFCNVTTITFSNSQPCSITVLPANTVTGLDLATYSVQLTNASNTVAGGSVVGGSIELFLNFGETESPVDGTVPEPSSLLMLSSGLLGLGFIKRKVLRN